MAEFVIDVRNRRRMAAQKSQPEQHRRRRKYRQANRGLRRQRHRDPFHPRAPKQKDEEQRQRHFDKIAPRKSEEMIVRHYFTSSNFNLDGGLETGAGVSLWGISYGSSAGGRASASNTNGFRSG